MIDTGAAPNVIKRRNLHPHTPIAHGEPLYLSGITNGRVKTLGSVEIKWLGHLIKLYVVPDNFPIAQEGILGSDFLRDATNINLREQCLEWQGVRVPFAQYETVVIPARSQATFYLRVDNPEVEIGYVPRLKIDEGIYAGNAIVSNRNGRAYIRVINTCDEDKELIVPNIQLQELESMSVDGPRTNDNNASVNVIHPQSRDQRVEQIKQLLRLEHLNNDESSHVEKLIKNNCDLFQLPDEELSCTSAVSHRIITTDDQPVNTKQYRFPPAHKAEIDSQVSKMIKNKIIQTSSSPYNSPLWIVPKKADSKGNKKWRLVIDFRALNEKTLGDAYPLPNISDILDQLGSAKYFSVFDLASGFHQIPMAEEDAQKTAFSTPFGHYEFKRMPFGLKNAPATFQRLMDRVLSGLQGIELFVYLDDIVIYASSLTEHNQKFNKLAERLRSANLRLQPDKCEFLRKEVTYLGHIISEQGVRPDPQKIEAVKNFPRPTNAKNIKQFLGLAGYYRRFLNNFSKVAKPLTALLKKDQTFNWQEPQETAFVTLRDQLCTEPLLQHPDFTRPFILTTDASGYAIGGILSQGEIGKDKPIAYASRLLNAAEQNYSTIEKESLAIIYCVNHFRPYLYGNSFIIMTDHKPLEWLHSVKDPTSRLVRWRLKLAEYDYKVMYKAGKNNCNADALSRNPVAPSTPPYQKTHRANMFPLDLDDSDDETLFDPTPRRRDSSNVTKAIQNDKATETAHTAGNDATLDPTPQGQDVINMPEEIVNDTNLNTTRDNRNGKVTHDTRLPDEINETFSSGPSDIEADSSDTNDETDADEIFDNPNPGARLSKFSLFQTSRENIASQRDHVVVFINTKGEPCDIGAKTLHEVGSLPRIDNLTQARARPIRYKKNCYLIPLVIGMNVSTVTQREILKEVMGSLVDVIQELGLRSFSVCRSPIGEIPWEVVYKYIYNATHDANLTITICTNDIMIPTEIQREAIIRENHDSNIGGHKGVTKTYRRIRDRYYWPRMRTEIEKYIQLCRNCQVKKLVRKKTRQPMVLTDTPDAAFDKISMDIMGPLPTSHNGNSYILTIQDLLTKYSLAIPLRHAGAVDVAEAFTNDFICTYGAPKALLTDQGTHFINSLMKAVAKRFKISRFSTTAYRPQSNGSIERSHHVLWEYLKLVISDHRDWDTYLRVACFSYNTSVHEGTRFTPHELVFGKTARAPTSEPMPSDLKNESYEEYLTNLYNKLRDVQEAANFNLRNAKEKSKRYYDKRVNPYQFNLGDNVLLLKEPTHKLGDQYVGPYKIIELLKNNNVRLRTGKTTTRVVHSDKLKTLPTTPERRGQHHSRPSEDIASSSDADPSE